MRRLYSTSTQPTRNWTSNPHANASSKSEKCNYSSHGLLGFDLRTVAWPRSPAYNTKTLVCVYGPDGTCRGTLSTERLELLHHRFQLAAATGKHASLNPPIQSFEAEVAGLLCRHTAPTSNAKPQQWALPEPLLLEGGPVPHKSSGAGSIRGHNT